MFEVMMFHLRFGDCYFPRVVSHIFIFAMLLIGFFLFVPLIPEAKAAGSYIGEPKPMEFYFHYLDEPVGVAGIQTKYIMNTSQEFSFSTMEKAYSNSFYKPIGLPKIEVDFYLYPNLADPVTIDGNWQVFLWVNSSAYKPAGFTLQFKEITIGGVIVWDSGQISPTVTSSIGSYIDVPVYNYNLTARLTHAFNEGSTLMVAVEVNTGSSANARIWYDSPLFPSKVILPAKDYARASKVKTYSYDGAEADLFYYNWSQSQRIVTVRANVTDPFGGYDVHSVKCTISNPAGRLVVDDVDMVLKSDGQWRTSFSNMFEVNWLYPSTAQLGNYTVKVSVTDNNGFYRNEDTGSPSPFMEYSTHTFIVGVIVFYNPSFLVVDDVGDPVSNAQVYVTWPNGSRDVLPRYTSADGFINLTSVLPANYGLTIIWKDVLVNQSIIKVDSDGPYLSEAEVYRLDVEIVGNDGSNIHGAYVIIYSQNGEGYGLATTNQSGQAVFKIPRGIYSVEAHYSAEYWLNVVTVKARLDDISMDSSISKLMELTEFPPPIWTTTGFMLILAIIVVLIMVIAYAIMRRRRG